MTLPLFSGTTALDDAGRPEEERADSGQPPHSNSEYSDEGYGTPPACAELKGARLSLQLSVEDAEKACSIRADYIRAIEAADVGRLPGDPFDLGYVRIYAQFLDTARFFGKDPEWYVEEYRHLLGGRGGRAMPPPSSPPMPLQVARSLRLWPFALAALFVAAAWYGFVQVQLLRLAELPSAAGV